MPSECTYTALQIAEITGKHKTSITRRAKKESWPYTNGNGKGGDHVKYPLTSLPPDIQSAILIYNNKDTDAPAALAKTMAMLPALSPSVAAMAVERITGGNDFDRTFANGHAATARTPKTKEEKIAYYDKAGPEFCAMMKPRVQRIARIVEEAMAVPPGWGKRKWVETIAEKYETTWQSVYRYIDRYEKKGLVGLDHTNSSKGGTRAWTPEALTHWLGLCLKREHRKIQKKALYRFLVIEAQSRGWKIGTLESACMHYRNHPQRQLLEAYQKGGMRALDNALSPILRDYTDMAPFECLVGDQHRKNRWVVDDITGDVIRIEAYVWQDLRTRIIYGGACARRYDAYLMGLALRMGLRTFGAFGCVYTDNGQPEKSMYFKSILSNIRSYDLNWGMTLDIPADVIDIDGEEVYPACPDPNQHRLAIVKNAKAKMIEGTWRSLEDIMTNVFLLPGGTKTLGDDIHHQDIDQAELLRLRDAGKLPLMTSYIKAFYQSFDYYNREKHHRGVAREWRGPNRPAITTPFDCLRMCYETGWRPRFLSNQAIDLLFMAETERTVNRGRITLENIFYEHDALLTLHGERVKVRYDLVDEENILIVHQGQFLCMAALVEYSSMKDMDLAGRKIAEKRKRAKEIAEIYGRMTRPIQDMRAYGPPEQIEQVAALVEEAKERKRLALEPPKSLSQEQLEVEVAKLEALDLLPKKASKPPPARPTIFFDDGSRFRWVMDCLRAGGELSPEDEAFRADHAANLSEDTREFWKTYLEMGG